MMSFILNYPLFLRRLVISFLQLALTGKEIMNKRICLFMLFGFFFLKRYTGFTYLQNQNILMQLFDLIALNEINKTII